MALVSRLAFAAHFRSWLGRSARRGEKSRPPLGHRPSLEELEGRELLATTGVYDLLGTNANFIPPSVLNNPNVDGIALRSSWDTIETADGTYDWSYFDRQIAKAASAGKMVSLSVAAGIDTPSWVYQEGAASFTTAEGDTIPVPWDPVFLDRWQQFIQAFGSRYDSNPAVSNVKITGIEWKTPETMLPHSADDVAVWQNLGYTRTNVENAWKMIADTFSQSFPDTQIAVEMVPNGFPPLDDNGNVMPGRSGDNQIVSDLIALGIASYGPQFIVQNDGLSDFWVSAQVKNVSGQVTTGYQMLWYVTDDPTYRMNGGTPIDYYTELQQAVDQGVAAGANFLEIYNMDVSNPDLQDVIANAHSRLS